MTTATLPAAPPRATPTPAAPQPRRFATAAALLHFLGDVPPERVILDPLPGTATEADLLRLCEGEPKRLCELIDGILVEKAVGYLESVIAGDLLTDINIYSRRRKLGVVSGEAGMMRILANQIRLPDVAFVTHERLAATPDARRPVPSMAPDLAVEVLSDTNTKKEMAQKLRDYFAGGTRLVWYVDPPTRTVAVYHKAGEPSQVLTETDALDGEDVLPGFSLPVADVFRGVPGDAA